MIGILLIVYAGLEHAFEVDHLLAVNNLVTNRTKIKEAVKDGIYWGVGHTLTIFVVGILMIGFKVAVNKHVFSYLEATVGIMLIGLGIYRLLKLFKKNIHSHTYSHKHSHSHSTGITHSHLHSHTYSHSHSNVILNHEHPTNLNNFKAAFSIGLVHGLAGSGALVVLVLTQMQSALQGLIYIFIFGIGSILGMFLASGLFSIPFTKSFLKSPKLQFTLVIISSLLCIVYGFKVVYENLFA
ncbi:sulfite exporter TauE/SafE family protein [Flavobacterium sp.]|uniref:urease accessory protein UreH domain-containing protein n=1 Tax=Flavobacterium sp. TaxID=239 RepID=UPI0025BDB2D7|nr:sulfite exporter TauE/SafE family protein [Flavobacterium sp.]MBA4154441.1 urease accessory protein [Flavobacterium sp.]